MLQYTSGLSVKQTMYSTGFLFMAINKTDSSLKNIFFCLCLLTLMPFQTCMTFFLLWNIKKIFFRNYSVFCAYNLCAYIDGHLICLVVVVVVVALYCH